MVYTECNTATIPTCSCGEPGDMQCSLENQEEVERRLTTTTTMTSSLLCGRGRHCWHMQQNDTFQYEHNDINISKF